MHRSCFPDFQSEEDEKVIFSGEGGGGTKCVRAAQRVMKSNRVLRYFCVILSTSKGVRLCGHLTTGSNGAGLEGMTMGVPRGLTR